MKEEREKETVENEQEDEELNMAALSPLSS